MLEPISDFPLDLAVKQSAEQCNLGARAHLRPLAEGNVKGDDILDHGTRFEFVKRAGGELDAETGQESTFICGSNDTRSDPSTVSQPARKWSGLDAEDSFLRDGPTESREFGTADHPPP